MPDPGPDHGVERLPGSLALADVVRRAQRELHQVDPLGALLLGDDSVADGPHLPDAGADAHQADRGRLLALSAELEALVGATSGEDEVDRMALLWALRRATPNEGPRGPAGAVLLERHLLARLSRLGRLEADLEHVLGVLEQAPGFLEESRDGSLGGPAPAGEVALAATKRIPAVLDAIAAAAAALAGGGELRPRVEAALGEALAAAAEYSGWILKEYVPAAAPVARDPELPSRLPELGFGADLDELEAAAEQLLAEQAVAREDPGVALATPPDSGRGWNVPAVAAKWLDADAAMRTWCPGTPEVEVAVEPTPAWLQALVPPLALVTPGPLSTAPMRLLVGPTLSMAEPDLDASLRATWVAELAPAAWQRAQGRTARLLLPASDLVDAWRVHARAAAPGLDQRRTGELGRELSWRAMLALVGAGFIRGRLDVAEGASLLSAETGMDAETARLQSAHVAAQPMAALTFVAGRRALDAWWRNHAADAAAARGRLLAIGPVPAAALGG